MKVKLVSSTHTEQEFLDSFKNNSELQESLKTQEGLMIYAARVSSPNQENPKYSKLLKHCMEHGHWSIFEMADVTFEVETSRGISPQILRHRSFSFQEFCMSGKTEVYFDLPSKVKQNKRQLYKLTLEDIYKKWNEKDAFHTLKRSRIKKMFVRSFDLKTKTFIHSHIKNVFKTGKKEIYEIELFNGKKIQCTKEHKVFTKKYGFISLEKAFGLGRNKNIAFITDNDFIACNGIPVYQNYEWLLNAKKKSILNKTGLSGIAGDAGVSPHTIRKWLKKHNLSFSKKEVASMYPVWNKGKYGYSWGSHSEKTKEIMRKKARKGPSSNLWKGGTTTERKQIQADIQKYKKSLIEDYNSKCGFCNKKLSGVIDLHHIKTVCEYPELAREYKNLMPVHDSCHDKHHKIFGNHKKYRENSKGNTLTVSWSKIKKVKYLGIQETYDLEIENDCHNYIANGVVVHNSQRYQGLKSDGIEIYEARRQDKKNRQNSIDDLDFFTKLQFELAQKLVWNISYRLYDYFLKHKVAKECARFLLPLNTKTRLYMKGSVRSWIHYFDVRCDPATQKEHREIALALRKEFCKKFPTIAETKGWK